MASVAVRSKVVVLLLFIHCLIVAAIVCDVFVLCSCIVMQYVVSFLVFQSSRWGRERERERGGLSYFVVEVGKSIHDVGGSWDHYISQI